MFYNSVVQEAKRCTNCNSYKPVEEFSCNARMADRRDLHCRECIRDRMRKKKARYMLDKRCADCGALRGDSRSARLCQRCLSRHAGTRRSREMRAAALRAYGGESP